MNDDSTIVESTREIKSLYSDPVAKRFLSKVYLWMALSLLVAAGTAVYSSQSIELLTWCMEHMLALALGSLVIICIMSFGVNRLTSGALAVLLMVFSVVEGLWFGPLLTIYTQQSLGTAFACTAGTFGVMAIYGALTHRNLSVMGNRLLMILIGLIICLVVNLLWLQSGTLDLVLSFGGVVLFSLLTAHDTQKILVMGANVNDEELRAKGAVMGALTLYLDFINIFLFLLRILGDRR